MAEPLSQRLFFALWPPSDIARHIHEFAQTLDLSGRPVASEKYHITLAFCGRCDAGERDVLIARAARIDLPAIDLVFDRLDCFQKPSLVWLGMSSVPHALFELSQALGSGHDVGARFVPHITILRWAAPIEAQPVSPLGWRARQFALVESGTGGSPGTYRIIARWSLGTDGTGPDVK